MVLGFGLLFLALVAPLVGIGAFLYVRGRREEAQLATARKERRILDMVQTRGQVQVSDLVLELQADVDQVKAWIYDLVGKGLFTGYINWDEGILYSREISQLRTNRCPRCGGELGLGGKGIVRCPYCGTEIFLA
jgi:DNA-directed RNA polymerase subunit RPC12/RpoP